MRTTIKDIERVQDHLFGMITDLCELHPDNDLYDTYTAKKIQSYVDSIDKLERWKDRVEIEWEHGLPFKTPRPKGE